MGNLRAALLDAARAALPLPGQAALNRRQAFCLEDMRSGLRAASVQRDGLLAAEHLRLSRRALDSLIGHTDVEAMLDALFGRFCIGK
jgi:tRNA modification GTPase